MAETLEAGPHLDFNAFMDACGADADMHGVKLTAKCKKLLQSDLCCTGDRPVAPTARSHLRPV
ncbi:hypothetical protein DAMNIGENAA_02140 [Desulforhabdus amnigena]|uniref:Uncharacterized protein n=1 Tax=Desulforhabdus amnigena TaxID=40218 RepID=A0A9W6FTA8_9BACT|nr:hypothetical protein DAMNIGENAA_02140 [Desulforhabdus amnigena]